MALKGKAVVLTTTDQDIYVCPSTQEASAHALVFGNTTGGAVTITLKRYTQATAATTTLISGKSVAANSTYEWPKPINLAVGDKIIASASANSSITLDLDVYEKSATPAEVGFTPQGAWSSATAYVANDLVSYNGSSYIAIQASTNQNPASATAYWMISASKGDTGAAGTGDVTTNTAQTITASKRGTVTTDADGSFDMNVTNNFSCTPTGAITIGFTNITAGQSGYIQLVNGSNYTISKQSYVKMPTGLLTTLSATGTYQLGYHSPDGTNVNVFATPALS